MENIECKVTNGSGRLWRSRFLFIQRCICSRLNGALPNEAITLASAKIFRRSSRSDDCIKRKLSLVVSSLRSPIYKLCPPNSMSILMQLDDIIRRMAALSQKNICLSSIDQNRTAFISAQPSRFQVVFGILGVQDEASSGDNTRGFESLHCNPREPHFGKAVRVTLITMPEAVGSMQRTYSVVTPSGSIVFS